jgi:hypothetical protein
MMHSGSVDHELGTQFLQGFRDRIEIRQFNIGVSEREHFIAIRGEGFERIGA